MRGIKNAVVAYDNGFVENSIGESNDPVRWPDLLAQSSTPLRGPESASEAMLVAGKIQNLRIAAARLDGLVVSAMDLFSFWKIVGRPSASRGFVDGRELREGCMIASTGGGLCQISNALYSVALEAGFEIVERHPHSRIIPGSLAEHGRDATVFWNYIDLRFRSVATFRITARLTNTHLVVQLHGHRSAAMTGRHGNGRQQPIVLRVTKAPGDCLACEASDCVKHIQTQDKTIRTAYLLDDWWPEFDQWLASRSCTRDIALMPVDGIRRNQRNYAWAAPHSTGMHIRESHLLTLRRSISSRLLASQGAARQRKLLDMSNAFAKSYAKRIPIDADHIVVPISMLAELWRLGVMGGRTFTILMNRAPIAMLHRDLDRAAARHPASRTLADFRATDDLLHLEDEALRAAAEIITPHAGVAKFLRQKFVGSVTQLEWSRPTGSRPERNGKEVLFPASPLGRKGAYEVRAACLELGLTLKVLGQVEEHANFWSGVVVSRPVSANAFDNVGCVVLPAFVEQQPRLLLKAASLGIPVICSEECGIPLDIPGVKIIAAGDTNALVDALTDALTSRDRASSAGATVSKTGVRAGHDNIEND